MVKFQFPSNGKVFPNDYESSVEYTMGKVSIPFKREGISEQRALLVQGSVPVLVSIPFKREGISELKRLCIKRYSKK